MEKHNFEACPMRTRHDKNQISLIGRFWRWHINFCPGWKNYFQSLDAEKQQSLREQYHLKRP